MEQAIVLGDGVFAILLGQRVWGQGLVIMEDFVEVFRTDCGGRGIDASIYVGVAFFVKVGFAVVFEDPHFGCHDFDDGLPGGFVEFVGRNEGMTAAAGGFDHGFILQCDFLCFGVYVVVCVFVRTSTGKELGKQ